MLMKSHFYFFHPSDEVSSLVLVGQIVSLDSENSAAKSPLSTVGPDRKPNKGAAKPANNTETAKAAQNRRLTAQTPAQNLGSLEHKQLVNLQSIAHLRARRPNQITIDPTRKGGTTRNHERVRRYAFTLIMSA